MRRPAIAVLWLGQVCSAVGDYLYSIAALWIAVRLAGSLAGVVAGADLGAGLAVGLVAGAFADRWDRRRAMVGADILRGHGARVRGATALKPEAASPVRPRSRQTGTGSAVAASPSIARRRASATPSATARGPRAARPEMCPPQPLADMAPPAAGPELGVGPAWGRRADGGSSGRTPASSCPGRRAPPSRARGDPGRAGRPAGSVRRDGSNRPRGIGATPLRRREPRGQARRPLRVNG
jgi:hypothetical protein